MRYNCFNIILLATLLCSSGCKKFIDANLPIDQISDKEVYEDLGTAVAAVTGVYAGMANPYQAAYVGEGGISIASSLMADELAPRLTGTDPTYLNRLTGADGFNFWVPTYRIMVYSCNAAIRGLERSKGLADQPKQLLIGEMKFTRAWLYFNLVNFYGDVPLITVPDFKVGQNIARSSKEDVYKQIVKDLEEAQAVLTDQYLSTDMFNTTQERVRPNKGAATALLARVYLFTGQWAKAEQEATKLISNTTYYTLLPLNDIFLKNSREAIWQMQPSTAPADEGPNTPDGRAFLNTGRIAGFSYFLTNPLLLDAFEHNDQRKANWFTESGGYIMPYKYKQGTGEVSTPQTEYTMVFRLGEQYLIRAEARARQNRIAGANSAESDLNAIRGRAGLQEFKTTVQQEMLNAIIRERYTELFTEWGDRWMTLQRMGIINTRMAEVAPLKNTSWEPYKALLPIPYEEFLTNALLKGHQNPGYLERP